MRTGIAAVSMAALGLLFCPNGAEAVKPSPPATIACVNTGSSGDLYTLECTIEYLDEARPSSVEFLPPPSTEAETSPAINKGDVWVIKVRPLLGKGVALSFRLTYGESMKITLTYPFDPFYHASKASPPPARKGKVVTNPDGTKVREYKSE